MSEFVNPSPKEDPFRVRLITALGMPVAYYAADYLWPGDYHAHMNIAEKTDEVNRRAWEAVTAGTLQGRIALEFIDDQHKYSKSTQPGSLLYHGTPYIFQFLRPHQATWQDSQWRDYADGSPAICASDTFDMPVTRSLLHDNRPEFRDNRDVTLILAKHQDRRRRVYWFTSTEALAAVSNSEGKVYAFYRDRLVHPNQLDERPPEHLRERDEYRVYGMRDPIARITTTAKDLPGNLLVLSNQHADKLADLSEYENPRQMSDDLGIDIHPLGDVWPLDCFPH